MTAQASIELSATEIKQLMLWCGRMAKTSEGDVEACAIKMQSLKEGSVTEEHRRWAKRHETCLKRAESFRNREEVFRSALDALSTCKGQGQE